MYIIEGIPLTNIPRREGLTFSYFNSLPLERGTIAVAPVGKRDVGLLVLSSVEVSPKKTELKKSSFKLRPLKKKSMTGHVSEPTIQFIEWLTRYYCASSGQFAKLVIPSYVLGQKPKDIPKFSQHDGGEFTFAYDQSPLRFASYVKQIEQVHNNGLQSLVLFPESIQAEKFFDRLPPEIQARALLWAKPTSKKREHTIHKKIIAGDFRTIMGTRSASLLPIPNLGLIIVEGEDNDSHKSWDRTPHYDSRVVSLWRATTYHIALVYGSDIPSLSTLSKAAELNVQITPKLSGLDSVRTHVVDMKTERVSGNLGPLSEVLKRELSLLRNQQGILHVQRRGEYTALICSACAASALCPACGSVLITQSEKDYLFCRYCAKEFPYPDSCPQCAGTLYRKLGTGVQRIEEEIKALYPNHSVERLDSDSVKDKKRYRDIVEKFNKGKIDILIGTSMVVKPHILRPVHLAAIVDADSLFYLPEFNSEEKLLSDAYKLRTLAHSSFIWQTNLPEHEVVFALTSNDSGQIFENMLERRKKYGWPPAVQLIQISIAGKRDQDTRAKSALIYQNLQSASFSGVTIYPPLKSKGKGGGYRILLSFEKTVPISRRNELMSYVPSNWDIDVDPINTIN